MPDPTKPLPDDKEVAAAIADIKKQPSKEIEIELSTGEKVKAASYEEAAKILQKMKEDTTVALRDRERQIEEYRAREQAARAAEESKQRQAAGQFDDQHYWGLLNDGKIIEAANYVDAMRFGVKPEDVVPTFSAAIDRADKAWDFIEVEQFKRANPDYPSTPQAAEAIAKRVQEYGTEWDSRTMTRAYKDLVDEGAIEPLTLEETSKGRPHVPPKLEGTSSGGGEVEQDLYSLSKAELDELVRRYGLRKQ